MLEGILASRTENWSLHRDSARRNRRLEYQRIGVYIGIVLEGIEVLKIRGLEFTEG